MIVYKLLYFGKNNEIYVCRSVYLFYNHIQYNIIDMETNHYW